MSFQSELSWVTAQVFVRIESCFTCLSKAIFEQHKNYSALHIWKEMAQQQLLTTYIPEPLFIPDTAGAF